MAVDERSYYDIVDHAFASRHEQIISNGKPEHAAYLIEKLFSLAQSNIRCFSGKLAQYLGDGTVPAFASPAITDAARRFMQKPNSSLLIVSARPLDLRHDQTPADHPLLAALLDEYRWGFFKGRFELRQLPADHGGTHFFLMDETACRVELDDENVTAVVAINNKKTCHNAKNVFDRLWSLSKPIFAIPSW